jgi:NAD(P)H-nitrite reductase large subunit
MALTAPQRRALRYVILGNSVAGIAAAQEIRRHDPDGQVTVVSDERTFGYSRAMLPLYIAGKKTKQDTVFAPRSFYASERIRLLKSQTAAGVDAQGRQVHLESGRRLPYDRLLVATGSSSRTLDVPGKGLAGIFPLRKMADAEAIKRDLRSCRGPIVIVGGGLVGVKSLEALAGKKKQIHLVISSDRILSQMLDRTASDFFLRAFEQHGVRVHFHADVTAFHGGERLDGVSLSDGTRLACDLAIIGKGVVAEPINVLQQRSAPSTIWPSATEGGRIAGLNMAGVSATFSGALRMNSVEILGVRVISAGVWEGGEKLTSVAREKPLYRKLIHADGRLNGFLLLGDVRCAGVLTSLVKNRTEVSAAALARDLERGFSFRPRLYALGGAIQARECGGMGN